MADGWKFLVVNNSDMGSVGEVINPSSRTLSVDLSKNGSASCVFPLDEQVASLVFPWKTALVAQYDDTWFWSGPIKLVQKDWETGTCTVNAVAWFEKVVRRLLRTDASFVDMDAGLLAFAMLAIANNIWPTRVVQGSSELTQIRTRNYPRDQSIGQAIQDLADLEAGYDWYVDPVTRELNFVARRGNDLEEIKWLAVQDGDNNNLTNVIETIDGDTLENVITPRGKGVSGYAEDDQSINDYDMHESAPSLSTVSEQPTLDAYANAEIVYLAQPRVTYSLSPRQVDGANPGNVPRLFHDFNLGDTTYLTAKRGGLDVTNQAVRVFGCDLSIDRNGVETITRLTTNL